MARDSDLIKPYASSDLNSVVQTFTLDKSYIKL